MQCTVLPHITASVFINDDEYGLHQDCERWLEEVCSRLHPAPHVPISHCRPRGRRPKGRLHNRTGQACLRQASVLNSVREQRRCTPEAERNWHELRVMGREVVVAITNGRLDGSTELAEVFGTWERIF